MRIKAKKILRNPWVISVGSIIIAQIILSRFDFNLIKEIIIFLINLIGRIRRFFASTVSLPVWAFIFCIMGIPIIVILIALLTPKKKETGPSPYDYKRDTFDGMVWRWNYYHNKYEKRMEIENLVPFCPKCDCQLRIHGNGHLSCPNCGFEEYNFRRSESDLRMLIYHQIRQRYFPDR